MAERHAPCRRGLPFASPFSLVVARLVASNDGTWMQTVADTLDQRPLLMAVQTALVVATAVLAASRSPAE